MSSPTECETACEADRARKADLWGGATLAYCEAARQRILTVERCTWPPKLQDVDGICEARYTGDYTG